MFAQTDLKHLTVVALLLLLFLNCTHISA